MTHIKMILKHLFLSGMLGIILAKITWFLGYILLPLLCSMSFISPNFDVRSIIFFPILARDLFPKLLEKALMFELKRRTIPGVSEQACSILILFPSSPIMLGPFINLMADKMVLTSTTPLPSVSNC